MRFRNQLALLMSVLVLVGSLGAAFAQDSTADSASGPRPDLVPPRYVSGAGEQGNVAQPPANAYSLGHVISARSGLITCIHKPQIAALTDGLIQEILVEEGSIVSKGDPILIIDSRVAQAELEVAQKQLETARIIAAQEANLLFSEAARELAFEEFQNERELFRKGSTTENALKRKQLEAQKTKFSVDMALDERKKYELEAAIAEQQVHASQVKLGLSKVLAPFDGIIVERKRDLGEWIRAGEPVVRLLHMDEMRVEALVPLQGVSLQSLEGAEMLIRAAQGPFEAKARVEFVSPELDIDSVRVTTRVLNQQVGGSWLLRDGMKADVQIMPVQ